MRDNAENAGMRLCALAEAVRLTREAYESKKDGRLAEAALVLAELAMDVAETIMRKEESNDSGQIQR